ncbi:reverse transcriptase domain-containing protein [Pseudoduganella aquatica]|uniref:Reverse transcriptase domain-containing protein n=1 Tax=Pseudoduganella aquatica TaxID=2660641 RepID=A0A7X4HBD4_9BURK|nr:reverse transcriptase domain-containing protein [Pseudoduganella aquatica]MYN08055.1 hypothetical protein [Pseudoduganella aquatica]
MNNIEKISAYIAKYFGSTANFYVKQVSDGSYRKTAGSVNAALVKSVIANEQSIACYQRNVDHTINWICFDFDILKSNLGTASEAECEKYLLQIADRFSESLVEKNIQHLLEFSGNRGIHIWIGFSSPIFPYIGFEIVKYLLDQSGISIDRSMIGLDLFPSSASHKSTHGKAVKIPLSRHAKSGFYSVLVPKIPTSFSAARQSLLDEKTILQQLALLQAYVQESLASIEEKTGYIFESNEIDNSAIERVRKIKLNCDDLGLNELMAHWSTVPLVSTLAQEIEKGTLPHAHRELLVGLLSRLVNLKDDDIGQKLLIEIFSKMPNYDVEKTKLALSKLKNLPFPDLEMVEHLCNYKHSTRLDKVSLAMLIMPNVCSVDDGLFSIKESDVKVTIIAERNYLYQNDEVRCIRVIEELSDIDFQQLEKNFGAFIDGAGVMELYRHKRKELKKENYRELITLSAPSRLYTTWAIKHLVQVYDYESSPNSYGYKMNPNFAGGHIFKPWLYQWVEFLSDIADVINNELNSGCYIVKADIKSFYDSIPQDNLERLLLTGLNNTIFEKLETMSQSSAARYKDIVRSLMRVTQECNAARTGVPQGPAYARVLAELYLGQIDELMDGYLASGELIFYHRYVDDIFFVVATRPEADNKLAELSSRLSLLGLALNAEKTSISKINNFDDEFDKYRAQAKYAIDAVSSNIDNATPYEKNMALLEYNKLISRQAENDDAVFLFSHLPGFEIADRYRSKAVNSIIVSEVGRGNLFKHVFIYLLSTPDLWPAFNAITRLSELQSEVFTSVCANILADQRDATPDLVFFIESQLLKLTDTKLVNEHKVYLKLYYNVGKDIGDFEAEAVLKCIRSAENSDQLIIDKNVLDLTASTLNGISDLGEFVAYLYPMCIEAKTNHEALQVLAKIFSAKIAGDEKNGRLRIDACGETILCQVFANKFYQLLCLFTLSTAINNSRLLERAWEFCATIFNSFSELTTRNRKASWYRNFDQIDVNNAHLNIAVTCITEKAIWRGEPDKHGIYINYHNSLMVFVLTGGQHQTLEEVRTAIGKVRDIGAFYQWLFSNDVDLFPSRKWFIENLIKNDCILLKREDQILIRKRVEAFVATKATTDSLSKTLVGYADDVVPYKSSSHTSIFDLIVPGRKFFTNLRAIKNLVGQYATEPLNPPNLFSPKSMLTKDGVLPFSDELRGAPYLIYEKNDKIDSVSNSFGAFLKNLFMILDSDSEQAYSSINSSMTFSNFYSRYILQLDAKKEVASFLHSFDLLSNDGSSANDEVGFDLTVASSIYGTQDISEAVPPFAKVKAFFDKYNRIHRSSTLKHIYMVEKGVGYAKENLSIFIQDILKPIDAARNYRVDLALALGDDIREYKARILEMILDISAVLTLEDFVHSNVTQSIVTEKILVNGLSYSYENVFVVNPASGLNQSFASEHVFLLQSSEDIFSYSENENVFLFFTPKEFTISYSDILDRQRYYFPAPGKSSPPYPYVKIDLNLDNLDINLAVKVIAAQRDISNEDADNRIRTWLSHIPEALRRAMVRLIEAHEMMSHTEIRVFRAHFEELRAKSKNPVLLKRFRDFGGVHRILADNAELARSLDDCGLDSLPTGAREATIFSDLGLSGGQIVKSLKYYLDIDEIPSDKMYFGDSGVSRTKIGLALRELKKLNLCFVLYTDDCIEKIKTCLLNYGLSTQIEVTCGRNISATAFLGTTQKLSVGNKETLFAILKDKEIIDHLMNSVFITNRDMRKNLRGKISICDSINLVCRFQSMPKKALDFLTADLRGVPGSALFERVRELGESKPSTSNAP